MASGIIRRGVDAGAEDLRCAALVALIVWWRGGCSYPGRARVPSPIAHATAGYVLYRLSRPGSPAQGRKVFGRLPVLLLAAIGVSLLPDLDSALGIAFGDFGRYHNNGTHSLLVGLLLAALAGGFAGRRQPGAAWRWALFAFSGYASHVLLDFFTVGGRGVMAFWPLTEARFESPVKLFYGVRWSEGLFSVDHLWTIANELTFLAIVLILPLLWRRLDTGLRRLADSPFLQRIRSLFTR